MHPHCMQIFVIRPQALRIQINPIDSCQCSNEFGAQLNLTKVTKREVTTPVKHVLLPVHVKMAASSLLSFTGKKKVLSQLPTTSDSKADLLKNWSPTAASCSTKRLRQGEIRKMASSSLYLDELLIQKCKFGGRFTVSSLYLERYSPRGSCHLDESSMNHTLAQKHLIELLMWNASHVQKHFS